MVTATGGDRSSGAKMQPWTVVVLVTAAVTGVGGQREQDLDAGDTTVLKNIKSPDDIESISDWKAQCNAMAGQEAIDDIDRARKELVPCITNIIDINKLQSEINISIPRGELDLVFKKYCKKREAILNCTEDFFSKLEVCLTEQQQQDLNVTRRALNAGIDFICHKEGDRIALFMAEKGEDCVKEHIDDIKECVKERVPDHKNFSTNVNNIQISSFTISGENCEKVNAMHGCVVKYTELCDDPTPSNILDSLITQVLKVTPCFQKSGAPPAGLLHHLLPHLLILLAAALTAANILL